jgi:hypothetical protein
MIFKPRGALNIQSDPSQIPDDQMQRCKNLNLETRGMVELRRGSWKLGSVAFSYHSDTFDFMIEHGGDRYYFATDGSIYKNEFSTESLFDSNGLQLYDVNEIELMATLGTGENAL